MSTRPEMPLPAPLVSVVLPTHNRPEWLAEALTSVLDGDFDDLEVIVSDNGDPGPTRRLRARLTDPRVRWVEQDRGLAMLDNMLAGYALARGRYVAVLHDDDRWSPRLLATLVAPLERHPHAVLAFADHYVMDASGRLDPDATDECTRAWGRVELAEGLHQPFLELAVARQSVSITSCVFRRASLPVAELTPEVGAYYDVWVAYLLAATGGAAYFSPERLSYTRERTAKDVGPGRSIDAVYCERRLLGDPRLAPHRDVLVRRLATHHAWAGSGLLRQGARGPARAHLRAALRLRPTAKALAWLVASVVVPGGVLARL